MRLFYPRAFTEAGDQPRDPLGLKARQILSTIRILLDQVSLVVLETFKEDRLNKHPELIAIDYHERKYPVQTIRLMRRRRFAIDPPPLIC